MPRSKMTATKMSKAELIAVVAPKYKYPPMSPREYQRALVHFDMPNTRFARLIGVQWRQAQRYRYGEAPVPEPVARLIRTVINHGLTAEDIG